MTPLPVTRLHPRRDAREQVILDQVVGQAADLTPASVERYRLVAETLGRFLDTVDVTPRLGPELSAHLAAARDLLGSGTFVSTLGVESLVRVLPEFLEDPWLPPAGAQRRTHRVAIDRLITFVRRELADPRHLRDDLGRIRRAVRSARGRDYWRARESTPRPGEPTATLTVSIAVRESTLDSLLDDVEDGRHENLADAVRSLVDPDPDPYPDRWRYGFRDGW